MAEQQQDVDTLKRRGRRRLVGALALVLAAVIVLPMVFDPEPRKNAPPVSVRIPGENDAPFTPRPPAKKLEEAKKAEEPPKSEDFVIAVGAFANADPVIAKLAAAKLPYYTEEVATAKGKMTRVRAGPFASKAAADKALEELKGLGFKPGNVTARS
jgi:DedD protein